MNNVMLTGKKLMGLDPTQRTTITLGKLEKERWFSPGKIIPMLSHVKEVVLYSANVFLQQIGSSACAVPRNIKREKANSMTQSLKVMS